MFLCTSCTFGPIVPLAIFPWKSTNWPSVAPLGVSLIPWGAQGPPYGVSLSWFLFIPLVIVLLLLSSFNISYHVGLLLSRLAFMAPVKARGGPINTEVYIQAKTKENVHKVLPYFFCPPTRLGGQKIRPSLGVACFYVFSMVFMWFH